MLSLLLVQIVSSMPIYGNFSQNYYYVELNNKRWILDQNFDGAIELLLGCENNQSKFHHFQAQRFILIGAIPLERKMIGQIDDVNYICNDTSCHMKIGDLIIQNFCGQMYTYFQEINNYLGLGGIIQKFNSQQQLKLCLAQNGGYMKIGNFQKDDQIIQIDQMKSICNQESNCQQNRLKLISLEIKQNFLFPNIYETDAEIDFTNTYVVFPKNLYLQLIKQFLCQGFFCPQRNDIDGLICYDNDYNNIDKFYEKFPKISFLFNESSEFIWFPQDYLVTHDNKTYCFPVKRGIGQIILGQPFMRNKEFIFGREKLIVNYQNCSLETSLDAPTISISIPLIKKLEIPKFLTGISLFIFTFIIYYILFKIKLRKTNQQLINPHIQ
ncbi:unnamed protein product [Paramecium primaurelia]|uniref:Xylanase inhibitor C-terminal domain-containing protein n=1 Tax=Paramecium primaurelia TaxID=5886 RepID=A0A8S1KI75_PARPR|nr:unnamed protein product [Paramecium primaurelia]